MGAYSITQGPQWIRRQNPWLRILIFLLILGLLWAPVGLAVYSADGPLREVENSDILALALLYAGFLLSISPWGKRIHRWKRPFARCGWIWNRQLLKDSAIALLVGTFAVFGLFGLQTLMGLAQMTSPSPKLGKFIVEGFAMAIAVGFAEEMLFRGWILAELETRYSSAIALVMTALFFATTHFIRPLSAILETLPQFIGLVVLGLLLGFARRVPTGRSHKTRIGYPIGLHAGLIWGYYIVNVGGLSKPTGRMPEWVTGIGDNPLAGLIGIGLLCIIAWPFAQRAQPLTDIK